MPGTVAQIRDLFSPKTHLAGEITRLYETFRNQRQSFDAEQTELRNYIFATSTKSTTNADLPWRNSTHDPKLTQLRDNLHANYMAALIPNDDWVKWQGDSEEDDAKAEAIESYLKNKTRSGDFEETLSRLVYDYIDTGNAFAEVEWVEELKEMNGELIQGYVGPRLCRISMSDIYINPVAESFKRTPKITRQLLLVGELASLMEEQPGLKYIKEAFMEADKHRNNLRGSLTQDDWKKVEAYQMDGFGNISEYYQSPYVELLHLEGDIYDTENGVLLKDHVITVMDRQFVIRKEPMQTWLPKGTKEHVGWRLRPDNLYAQGPLHNLVGMQYRIDHLENIKADVFDLIAFPPLKIRGEVEAFEWAPFAEIHLDEGDQDVEMLTPDTAALNADMQIRILEDKMELYAGAPREAMGVRTPGEKTAFEVQTLNQASERIFFEKVLNFEKNFLEPLLNNMLEVAKRNMSAQEIIRIQDDDIGAEIFNSITKDDITGKGKIRPMGARHFATQRQLVQNITGIFNTPAGELIAPHVSGKALAKMIEDAFGVERFGLIRDNIAVIEQLETQRMLQQAQQALGEEQLVHTEGVPGAEEGPI